MTLITTNHPITSRLHKMFEVKQASLKQDGDATKQEYLSGIADVFVKELSAADTGAAWSKSEIGLLSTQINQLDLRSNTEAIGRKLNAFFKEVIKLYRDQKVATVVPEYDPFQNYIDNVEQALRNIVALFMGLLVAVNDLLPLTKENFTQACTTIKDFMKDTAHMQMNLFFVFLNTLGIMELPSDSYPIKDTKHHFFMNSDGLSLTENFYNDINTRIQKDPKTNFYKGHAEFRFRETVSKRTFSNEHPAYGCPSLFIPVEINKEQISLADASLNWIEKVLEKSLLPILK